MGERCCDHSTSSGYHQICSILPEAGWLSERELLAGRLCWYRPPVEEPGPDTLFHVFYGDRSRVPAILRSRFPEAVTVSTLHQPILPISTDVAWQDSVLAVDAVITVSRVQAQQLGELGIGKPLYSVPHGVWAAAFRPASGVVERPREQVLLVGNHLRDWSTAGLVVERLAELDVDTVVLEPRGSYNRTSGDYFDKVLARVSEPELAGLYDDSAALFLPVENATASNALLEAMAAGCPVVSTDVPALVEYLGDRSDSFEYGAVEAAVSTLLAYVRDSRRRFVRSQELMRRARYFDWSELRWRYLQVYREVMPGLARRTAPGLVGQRTTGSTEVYRDDP